jgi:hypothetical protein
MYFEKQNGSSKCPAFSALPISLSLLKVTANDIVILLMFSMFNVVVFNEF